MASNLGLIFAVDDEPDNLELISRALDGYDVQTFTDPIKAAEEAVKNKPLAMVIDYRMPGINGVELIHRCRKAGLDCAIVIVTAFREWDEVVYAQQSNLAYQVIPKPFKPSRLKDWVQLAIMGNKRRSLSKSN